jgi:hypothetical protein
MAMGKEHIVAENEHLAGIAAQHGFSSIGPIWNHPENAKLKALRKNPNILFVGDSVFIPDRETKDIPKETDERHLFVAAVARLELHVKVHDQGFQPIGGDAEMTTGSDKTSMTKKGDVFEAPLRPDVKEALLDFPISKTARQRPRIRTQPGRLDPLETLPGQQQRLNNLGYFAGFVKTQATDPKKVDLQLRWAVEEFQRDHMGQAQVDGVLGPNTLKKLKEVYGC